MLAPYLADDDAETGESGGEEIFDLSGSDWQAPSEDEMDILDALMARDRVTVPNSALTPPAGTPLDDEGQDRQWL